jgi:hypothetical protein
VVTVERRGSRSSILYNGGLTPAALARNPDVLQVSVRELRELEQRPRHRVGCTNTIPLHIALSAQAPEFVHPTRCATLLVEGSSVVKAVHSFNGTTPIRRTRLE